MAERKKKTNFGSELETLYCTDSLPPLFGRSSHRSMAHEDRQHKAEKKVSTTPSNKLYKSVPYRVDRHTDGN
ncbi:hypothetical protein J6590_005001 [Homalodisca vitripennis]|nr:hypothetical protein J6590_005001 [Homalodisca vitripennis]